jgi:Tol biopolymer transport system component
MTLNAGLRIGPYEIVGLLGMGAMGEVYQARDLRLSRGVAIKILPAMYAVHPERRRRFEQEARAAGQLNHPNVVAIYDVGTHDGSPYVVSELLVGETLRARLQKGLLTLAAAFDFGLQTARGLVAAHEAGIIHRDLKPENLFLTTDARVKILDFGIAKLTRGALGANGEGEPTLTTLTVPGALLGTAGYMSPEQARGLPADERSDIFSFGAILYEMVVGERAFHEASPVETLYAILNHRPRALQQLDARLPHAVARLLGQCLEKDPQNRLRTVRDVVFELEVLTSLSEADLRSTPVSDAQAPRPAVTAGVPASPVFRRVTFNRGTVFAARFSPAENGIVYAASWDGQPAQLFATGMDAVEPRSLGQSHANLLAVGPGGRLVLAVRAEPLPHLMFRGTLAAGAPGRLEERDDDVIWADLAPDGRALAVVRSVQARHRLEYPQGRVLYETSGWIGHPRVSPSGHLVAFLDHPVYPDDGGSVAVVDTDGTHRTLARGWQSARGLAWSPAGDEVWFTAAEPGSARAMRAVTVSGELRVLWRMAGGVTLHDVARDGRLLLTNDNERVGMYGLGPGRTEERELSWLAWSVPSDLSADGYAVLFTEEGEAGGESYSVCVRMTTGSPVRVIGPGIAQSFSPDGRCALALRSRAPVELAIISLDAPETATRVLRPGMFVRCMTARWHPDGERLFLVAEERMHAPRCYMLPLNGGEPRAVTPEGVVGRLLAPDGAWIVAWDREAAAHRLHAVDGGASRLLAGVSEDEVPARWSADQESLYIFQRMELPAHVIRMEQATGQRELWRTLMPKDPAGVLIFPSLQLAPEVGAYVYAYRRFLSDLYVVGGIH